MLALFEEVPTSTSLLMQCGYRSKVCTSVRATKIDGSLHKLCEFHRRKANASQQRLHKRQREERVARRQSGATTKAKEDRPAKKICLNIHIPIDPIAVDPIPYSAAEAPLDQYPNGVFTEELATPTSLTSVDMDMLELLLLDVQPLPLLPPPNSDLRGRSQLGRRLSNTCLEFIYVLKFLSQIHVLCAYNSDSRAFVD